MRWFVGVALLLGLVFQWVEVSEAVDFEVISWCTNAEAWQAAEEGAAVTDREIHASRDASVRFDRSGRYGLSAVVEPFRRISVLCRAAGDEPALVVPRLIDRKGTGYDFPEMSLAADGRWVYLHLDLADMVLPLSSVDDNHRFDYPGVELAFDLRIPEGGSLHVDQIRRYPLSDAAPDGRRIEDRLARWDERLRRNPAPKWRENPPSERPARLTRETDGWKVSATGYQAWVEESFGRIEGLALKTPGAERIDLGMDPVWQLVDWDGEVRNAGVVISSEWDNRRSELMLEYAPVQGVSVTTRLAFREDRIEMGLMLANNGVAPIRWVHFPGWLDVRSGEVQSVIWPRTGGVELDSTYFSRGEEGCRADYPSECFANWSGIRTLKGFLSFSGLDTGDFFQPSTLILKAKGEALGYRLVRPVYVPPRTSWILPEFVLGISDDQWSAITSYREFSGIVRTPLLREKLGGERFERISRSLFLLWDMNAYRKANGAGSLTFQASADAVAEMQPPGLINPLNYLGPRPSAPEPGRENYTFYLPVSSDLGDEGAFRNFLEEADRADHLVTAELFPEFWDPRFVGEGLADPTVSVLPVKGVEFRTMERIPANPYHVKTKEAFDRLLEMHRSDRPADLLLLSQGFGDADMLDLSLGGLHPLAHVAGWMTLARRGSESFPLIVSGGFDRMLPYAVALTGSDVAGPDESRWNQDDRYGVGNWRVFPLDAALAHDRVAFYRYRPDPGEPIPIGLDLPGTFAVGANLETSIPGDETFLKISRAFQETVGARIFGAEMTGFRYVGPLVTESVFDGAVVIGNHHPQEEWMVDGETQVFPQGIYFHDERGRTRAGVFSRFGGMDYDPPRYLIEEIAPNGIRFRDALADGAEFRLRRHQRWPDDAEIQGMIRTAAGAYPADATREGDWFRFVYPTSGRDGSEVLSMEFLIRR